MANSLKGRFETRREAEMTIERLVQEYGVDRAAILVAAEGDSNSAGLEVAGSDAKAGDPEEPRDDAALAGAILVMVEIEDHATLGAVCAAFTEFAADAVEKS